MLDTHLSLDWLIGGKLEDFLLLLFLNCGGAIEPLNDFETIFIISLQVFTTTSFCSSVYCVFCSPFLVASDQSAIVFACVYSRFN